MNKFEIATKQHQTDEMLIITDSEHFTENMIESDKSYVVATTNRKRWMNIRKMFLDIGRICQRVDPINCLAEYI